MNNDAIIYFAYGANLVVEAMHLRCPGCQPLTRAALPNHRLVFRGAADIEFSPGDAVQGALYRITPEGLAALDRFESYPILYDRKTIQVASPEGMTSEAVVYQMVRQIIYAPPFEGYLNTILSGCRDWGIPEEYIRKIISAAAAAYFGGY